MPFGTISRTYPRPTSRRPSVDVPAPPLSRFAEKVLGLVNAGAVSFWPSLDRYTREAPEMKPFYREMLRFGVVKSALSSKINSVASLDLSMEPADDTPRDHDVAEFVERALTHEIGAQDSGGVPKVADTIFLHGLIDGDSVCEKVWQPDLHERGRWRGKRFYRDIKAKENIRVEVDRFKNIVAIVSTLGNDRWEGDDLKDFVFFRHMPLFEGSGTSEFRAAYGDCLTLDMVKKLRAIHLEKFTSPYFDVELADDPSTEHGGKVWDRTEAEVRKAASRSYFMHPQGVVVKAMQIATSGTAEFSQAVHDLEQSITVSIAGAFLHMLTSSPGGGDMRGDSQTQQGTTELGAWKLSAVLCQIINRQITPGLVDENFAGADYPTASLGGINFAEMNLQADLYGKAVQAGVRPSRKAYSLATGVQLATEKDDELAPPGQAQPPMGGIPGGFPAGFAEPGQGQHDFCREGVNAGKPGPCPGPRNQRQPKQPAAAPAGKVPAVARSDNEVKALLAKRENHKLTVGEVLRVSGADPGSPFGQQIAASHKAKVEAALAAGKDVPAEVLKDYPDLAKKPAASAPAQPSTVKHGAVSVSGDHAEVSKTWQGLFGGKSIDEAHALVGAPPGAKVSVAMPSLGKREGSIEINISSPDYNATRIVTRAKSGKLQMRNMFSEVNQAQQGKGTGSQIFAQQVEACRAAGVDEIVCHAGRENNHDPAKPYNGYYTWPRLGYDQSVDDLEAEFPKEAKLLKEAFPEAKSVLDVMSTQEGRDWWKKNGVDLTEAKFDLHDGSRSMRIYRAYLEDKKKRAA